MVGGWRDYQLLSGTRPNLLSRIPLWRNWRDVRKWRELQPVLVDRRGPFFHTTTPAPVSQITMWKLNKLGAEVLPHSPYSTNLASTFHHFLKLFRTSSLVEPSQISRKNSPSRIYCITTTFLMTELTNYCTTELEKVCWFNSAYPGWTGWVEESYDRLKWTSQSRQNLPASIRSYCFAPISYTIRILPNYSHGLLNLTCRGLWWCNVIFSDEHYRTVITTSSPKYSILNSLTARRFAHYVLPCLCYDLLWSCQYWFRDVVVPLPTTVPTVTVIIRSTMVRTSCMRSFGSWERVVVWNGNITSLQRRLDYRMARKLTLSTRQSVLTVSRGVFF